jgi:DNA-binding IclR family transcriptional regulator
MANKSSQVLAFVPAGDILPQKMSTVAQTIAVLRFLSTMSAPLGVNAISRELDMPASSCFRILKQLTEEGYAQFDGKTKCYSLGSAAVMLARRALDPANTFGLIQPSLAGFVAATETSLGFWRRIDRNRLVLAGFLESPHPMRIHMSIGQRLPLFIGAVGRAFASELRLSDEELEQEFSRLRWQDSPKFNDYRRQVDQYVRKGYATDTGNFAPGVTTVATILKDAMGEASFGLSAIHLSNQIESERLADVGESLVALKRKLHRDLYGCD